MLDFISPAATDILVNIFLAVISLLVTLVLGAVLSFLRANLTATQLRILEEVAGAAIRAAEQGELNKQITDKKGYAMKVVTEALQAKGIRVTEAQIDAAIESAVYGEFNRYKSVAPVADDDYPY